jgi:small nuclear ribonucleoprotein E
MNRGGGGGGRKVLLPPINFIFKLLQQRSIVQIWLYEQLAIRIEGRIRVQDVHSRRFCTFTNNSRQGFDEFMNLVIDDAVEVKQATKTTEESRRSLGQCEHRVVFNLVTDSVTGQILLKGDNVSLIQSLNG